MKPRIGVGTAIWLTLFVFGIDSNARADEEPAVKIAPEVEQSFEKLANRLKTAKSTRATVELTSRALAGEEELQSEHAVYQIASQSPDRLSIFYKAPGQLFRVYADSKQTSISLADDAYMQLGGLSSQDLISESPVPLGPYPEPVLALTLPNVDLKASMLANMDEVTLVNSEPLNQVPAIQIHGVQNDGVTWDLWISSHEADMQPLRLLVDLTSVIKSDSSELPKDFRYELECWFTIWKLAPSLDDKFFEFKPPTNAKKFDSLDAYYDYMEEIANRHPLVGQIAPPFQTKSLSYEQNSAEKAIQWQTEDFDLAKLKGKIIVLDMWATWCGPCIKSMPIVDEVAKQFKAKDVEFFALNVGESEDKVREFLNTAQVKPHVLLDTDGDIATQYQVNAIPQMVIINRDGRIEMVKVGWDSLETLSKELTESLQTLVDGGTLLTP